jgi:MoxR-like ATPase
LISNLLARYMKFTGTSSYIATRDLQIAVEASITLQKPLLIKGEPGTGKTLLAYEIARSLGKKLISWNIKSTTSAQQGLYEYDAISRLRDAQLNSDKVGDIRHYIRKGKLWEAFEAEQTPVLLIDEIDKADLEFPNDLLQELDRMEFYCYELDETICARQRPIVIITSNNEKELPDAFLRRCFFHYIRFPDADTLQQIVDVHYPGLQQELLQKAIALFLEVREKRQLKKRPSTSELLDWIKLLMAGGASPESLEGGLPEGELPPYAGALLKNEQDLQALLYGHAHRSYYP